MKDWRHRDYPSARYLGAIRRGYDEAKEQYSTSPSEIWDCVCMECLRSYSGFRVMFEWDRRKKVNRVGDIAEVIAAGLVPGLRMDADGRLVVEDDGDR